MPRTPGPNCGSFAVRVTGTRALDFRARDPVAAVARYRSGTKLRQQEAASYMVGPTGRVLMAETAIQFLERWRQAHVYAELRALEQLDETVAECIGAAAEDGISADHLEKAAGGSLKEYLRTAIINTSE